MRIGCIQFPPTLGDLQTTLTHLEALLSSADDIDLIVLPELCNSGYNFVSQEQAWETAEEVGNSTFINFLADHCQKHNSYIVSGFNEKQGSQLFNSAVLVGPDGYMGKYQKLHLFYNEKDFFQTGQAGLPIFKLPDCTIGIQVCFDWMYPEAWRILALKGADIICHPSNLVLPGLAQRAVPIRALTNRVFTITANRIGSEGDLTFTGMSTIANPRGEVLAQAQETTNEILRAEINPTQARDKNITTRNHIFKDRHPEQYRDLVSPQEGVTDEN